MFRPLVLAFYCLHCPHLLKSIFPLIFSDAQYRRRRYGGRLVGNKLPSVSIDDGKPQVTLEDVPQGGTQDEFLVEPKKYDMHLKQAI